MSAGMELETVPEGPEFLQASTPVAAFGHIDLLQWDGAWSPFTVAGWLVVPDQDVFSIEVFVNGRFVAVAPRTERLDVERKYPRLPGARESGFHLAAARIPAAPRGWVYAEVVGITRAGPSASIGTLFHPNAQSKVPIPPDAYSMRVAGNSDADFYRMSSLRSFTAFLAAIRRNASKSEDTLRVLDWGAGCARLTSALTRLARFLEVQGCDIDPETTAWAQEQLAGEARFRVIDPEPPTPFEDASFDIVLAYSVMTHLDRDLQLRWLDELKRILRPGGLLLATIHCDFVGRIAFGAARYSNLLKEGIDDTVLDSSLDGIAPEGYYRDTFQTRAYTEREWSNFFDIVEYRERGMMNSHDLVVMRAPDA